MEPTQRLFVTLFPPKPFKHKQPSPPVFTGGLFIVELLH